MQTILFEKPTEYNEICYRYCVICLFGIHCEYKNWHLTFVKKLFFLWQFADDLPEGFVIPDAYKAEGDALKVKIEALNLPKMTDGKHPDICKITDAALKNDVFAYIAKVNANGGALPTPTCT